MFKPSKARTVAEYFAALPGERKADMVFLDNLITKTVPELKPYFASNMPGYGSFQYKNNKKEIMDWPVIGLASQKNYISIYVCAVKAGKYIAEENAERLGKVKVGRSCISFKKVEDVHLPTLKKVLLAAAKSPGLAGAEIGAKKK